MVRGIGCDIIEISRIRSSISRHGKHFLNRVFTPAEQEYCHRHRDAAPHFAARFSAKEAVVKALGTGFRNGISWLDIEIVQDSYGKPLVHFSPSLSTQFPHLSVQITMSHCREYAMAYALFV